MASRNIRRASVDVLTIHLVGEEIQVVFLHQVANLVHFAACVQVASWVVGVTYHYSACALINQLLEFLYLGERETLLDGSGNSADFGSCRNGKGHIVGVSRLWYDNLIARIQAAQECKQHRLATTTGNDDIISCYVDIVLSIIVYQLFAIALITLRG